MDEPQLLEFLPDQRRAVVDRMVELARDRSGWINLQPVVDPEDEPPQETRLSGLLSGRGPAVPLATWTPGERHRRRVEPTTIGLQHATGTKAVARLASFGIAVPDGWRVLADHPRRGVVVVVPDGTDPDDVLGWLLEAGTALSAVPTTGRWRAEIYVRQ